MSQRGTEGPASVNLHLITKFGRTIMKSPPARLRPDAMWNCSLRHLIAPGILGCATQHSNGVSSVCAGWLVAAAQNATRLRRYYANCPLWYKSRGSCIPVLALTWPFSTYHSDPEANNVVFHAIYVLEKFHCQINQATRHAPTDMPTKRAPLH